MTYAFPAWAFITKTQYKRLQVLQNRALQLIGGYDIRTSTTKMHLDLKIPMLKIYVKSFGIENVRICQNQQK